MAKLVAFPSNKAAKLKTLINMMGRYSFVMLIKVLADSIF